MANSNNAETSKDGKRGIFRNVDAVSVIAPALAAATSFALISRVGLLGSLIGTAITAIVSTIATQVYKNVMADSAERIQELIPDEEVLASIDIPTMDRLNDDAGVTISSSPVDDAESDATSEAFPNPSQDKGTEQQPAESLPTKTADRQLSATKSDRPITSSEPTAESSMATSVHDFDAAISTSDKETRPFASGSKTSNSTQASIVTAADPDATVIRPTPGTSSTNLDVRTLTPNASEHVKAVAAGRRARALKRKIALFSAVVAIVMSLIIAGIIIFATSGHGIGPTMITPSGEPAEVVHTGTKVSNTTTGEGVSDKTTETKTEGTHDSNVTATDTAASPHTSDSGNGSDKTVSTDMGASGTEDKNATGATTDTEGTNTGESSTSGNEATNNTTQTVEGTTNTTGEGSKLTNTEKSGSTDSSSAANNTTSTP